MSDNMRADLHDSIDELTDGELAVVAAFVNAVTTPVDAWVNPDSWLTNDVWADTFRSRLAAHHALNSEPLGTLAFEAAFNASCETAGWEVVPAESATHRYFDTTVTIPPDDVRHVSLKASSARDMRRGWVHISKLTEAAWIQDARLQAERRDQIVALFRAYRDATDSIVMLRAFVEDGEVEYELLEIPTALFESVEDLTIDSAQRGTIPFPVDAAAEAVKFKVRIDRSDAKITLTGVQLEHCTVHARWVVDVAGEEEVLEATADD